MAAGRFPVLGFRVDGLRDPWIVLEVAGEVEGLVERLVGVEWRGGRLLFYIYDSVGGEDLQRIRDVIRRVLEKHGFKVIKSYLRWW